MTAVISGLNVSRETIDRLQAFQELVLKWTKTINLTSKQDTSEIWSRHILDSAQLYKLVPDHQSWVDAGSGGGFPGIVVAILGREFNTSGVFTLIESDQRKSAFLRTVVRNLDLNAKVITSRVEEVPPQGADVFSARAMADLGTLLHYAKRHMHEDGIALFPKGKRWEGEHRMAQKSWSYSMEVIESETNVDARILKVWGLERV